MIVFAIECKGKVRTCDNLDGHVETEHQFVPFEEAIANVVVEGTGKSFDDILQRSGDIFRLRPSVNNNPI